MCGWDPSTGNPGEVKLRELGLDWAWEALESSTSGARAKTEVARAKGT
jgi:hypothetical protein